MAKRAVEISEMNPQEGYQQLADIVRQIEAEEDQREEVVQGIKEIYREAKLAGFDAATIRRVVRKRRQDQAKLRELEEMMEQYESALERAGSNRPSTRRQDPLKET